MIITKRAFSELDGAPGVTMAPLSNYPDPIRTRIDLAHLSRGSSLPKHRAGSVQLFYVISGTGRAAGADDIEHTLTAGTLVEWEKGEEHTSWADTDMTVVIIQRSN